MRAGRTRTDLPTSIPLAKDRTRRFADEELINTLIEREGVDGCCDIKGGDDLLNLLVGVLEAWYEITLAKHPAANHLLQ